MTVAIVTPDQDAIVAEIDIAAPPERVFRALTDSAELMRWFNDTSCPVKFWEIDARVGGRYRYTTEKGSVVVNGISEFECHGEILEFDPPRLLVYTWLGNWHADKALRTVVRWDLTAAGTGTHVKMTHSGLAKEAAAREDYRKGWPALVAALKRLAESAGSIHLELHIAAPPERVFQAITDPQQLIQWWGQKGMYRVRKFTADLRPGGRWRSDGLNDDGSSFHVSGEYLEVDPPRLLVYTWATSWDEAMKTVVRWELERSPDGTRVRLQHTGFTDAESYKRHDQGWIRVSGWMVAFLEKGETVANRPVAGADSKKDS